MINVDLCLIFLGKPIEPWPEDRATYYTSKTYYTS